MSLNAKEAAQRLFDIADAIEKQASQKTFFVCDSCNHTANLESINNARAKFALENEIEIVASISIEDTISCKACGGDMVYAATEESEKFFVDASEDEVIEETEEDAQESPEDDADDDSEGGDLTEDIVDDNSDEVIDEEIEEEPKEEEPKDKPKKNTTKDKKDSDGKVEMKEEPKAQFGDDDKKKAKTAFDISVERYSM